MALLLYSLFFAVVVLSTVAYYFRHYWIHRLPIPEPLYTRLPTTFREDVEAGLHSNNFNLAENIEAGDSRSGLDATAKKEVQRIMKRRGVGFDEARRIYMQEAFKKGGIGEDGIPRDPKFVSFS
ncbi:hypothetical protein EJ04DRAFT_462128 [Polyplosphaeria fusca]|uniref:Uncharacterized protein n=1 Tax=Polyplosphaeria fusca TaxID=682080 RepID=A0A9P4R552_9PLEO|nr:hypothetical protein EJ04DRAFT_462128 [Polyplosphaeria fusca]